MSRKFLTSIDLVKNELQNGVMHPLGAAPSSPAKFQIYGNTTDNTLYWWDGTTWVAARSGAPAFGAVAPEPTFGSAPADGVATTVSHADHKHGNPVHDDAAHSAVHLNALAPPTAAVNMNGQQVTNVGAPTAATDATTKAYVDNLTAGLSWKDACRVGTVANITLSGAQTVNGVAVVAGDRVLVKNQTNGQENGIYIVAAGAWTRATDADTEAELINAAVWLSEGTALADTAWVMTTNAPITVGTTPLTWIQFAGGGLITAGAGLTSTGNTLDVGQGTGITVSADSVALDQTFTDGRYINSSGDTMTGDLIINNGPTNPAHATNKSYVDGAITAGAVPPARTVTAGAGLTGGGDLTANRTLDVGAGTGITVAADTVALDTAYTDGRYATLASAIKRFAADVGGAVSQVITHNLNTLDTVIHVYRKATPFDQVECDVEHTTVNTATLRFAVAPAAAEYRVVIVA